MLMRMIMLLLVTPLLLTISLTPPRALAADQCGASGECAKPTAPSETVAGTPGPCDKNASDIAMDANPCPDQVDETGRLSQRDCKGGSGAGSSKPEDSKQ